MSNISQASKSKRVFSAATGIVTLFALVAACGGGSDEESKNAKGMSTVRVVDTGGDVQPHRLNGYAGPIEFGKDYGIEQAKSSIKLVDAHSTGAQLLLSGRSDVLSSSFVSALQLQQAGNDIKMFCPNTRGFPSQIIGTGDLSKLSDINNPKYRVALESPGGPTNFAFDLVLKANNVDFTIEAIKNKQILDDSSLRLSALGNGDVDAGLINVYQVPDLAKQIGKDNFHILADVMPDAGPEAMMFAFTAKTKWLDEHQPEAAAFCASVLNAGREMNADYGTFKRVADTYITPKLDDKIAKLVWDGIVDGEIFPESNTLDEAGFNFNRDVAERQNLIKPGMTFEEMVDPRPTEKALSLLGEG